MTIRGMRRLAVVLAAGTFVAGACSASGDEESQSTEAASEETTAPAATEDTEAADTTVAATDDTAAEGESPETTEAAPEGEMFGTLASPCGEGEATIADGQNGGDKLKLGVATDKGFEGAPGLNIEMEDSAKAFAGWCNAQGGIGGLEIEIVPLDGKLFTPAPAMEQACAEVFAMVGGGWTFDEQMFPRFHECGMISFPGFTVTTAAAMANGKAQPIPNPSNFKPASWWLWAKENFPEQLQNLAIFYGNFQTTIVVKDSIVETWKNMGGFDETPLEIPYAAGGEPNWAPFVQQLKDNNITAMTFVGSANNLILLEKAMDEIGYRPELILQEANFYDSQMIQEGNAEAVEGTYIRTAYAPFEEADQFPGMASYQAVMDEFNPEGKRAGLGLQAMSAYLMFATSAKECLESNGNVLERECVLAAGKAITEWTGGGLHAPTDPSSNMPPACTIILQVQGGSFTRVFPELGGADDNGDGWHCDGDAGVIELTGDYGDASFGVDPARPN